MSELDNAYRSQRLRLVSAVEAGAAATWGNLYREPERRATAAVLPLVIAGQAATVTLLDAYMAAKVGAQPKALDRARYTTEALRGLPAEEVYERPFRALGAQLGAGEELPVAVASARAAVSRLVHTDLQLAQTHAARDWMEADERVYGYRRVLGGGKSCALCRAASTRIYYRESLMPIHERCHCTVEPLIGEHPGGLSIPSDAVRVAEDPELGPRLLEEGWAA